MRTSIRYLLATALCLGFLSVLPSPVHASAWCQVVWELDWDHNGTIDFWVGGGVDWPRVTVDMYPDRIEIQNCGKQKVFPGSYYTVMVHKLPKVTVNVMGDWVGIHRSLMMQLVLWPISNEYIIGGTGTMTDSSLLINLEAASGRDNLTVSVPTMNHSYFDLYAGLAVAPDNFTLNAGNPITNGSVSRVTALLGSGANQNITFSQTGLIDGTFDFNFEGGDKNDLAHLTLAGPVGPNGRLFVHGDLGAINDTFDGFVDLSKFSVAAGGEVHLDINGSYGPDILRLSRRTSVAGPGNVMAGLFEAILRGGTSSDTIEYDLGGGGFTQLDGTLRLGIDGGYGNDVLQSTIDVSAAPVTPNLDIYISGHQGTDQITCTINDNGPLTPANYGLAGTAFVDGGTEADQCTVVGNGLVHKRNCET